MSIFLSVHRGLLVECGTLSPAPGKSVSIGFYFPACALSQDSGFNYWTTIFFVQRLVIRGVRE